MRAQKSLWPCPACGRAFANVNQSHACGRYAFDDHFAGKPPLVRDIYEAFFAMLEEIGPVTVLPEKTRIAFQARMSFAQLTVRRHWVLGHFVLARRVEDPVFTKAETFSPRNHVHHFRLDFPRRGRAAARLRPGSLCRRAAGASRLKRGPRRSVGGCWRSRRGR